MTNQTSAPLGDKLKQAVALHQQGQLKQAQALYEQILGMQPAHAEALHLSGVAAAQSGNPARAVDLIGRALELDPKNSTAHCNRGAALHELKRWEEALASYDRALALEPNDAVALFNRGHVLRDLRRFDEALASYDRYIAIRADRAAGYYNRGLVIGELGQWDEALSCFDRAIELDRREPNAHHGRGNVLCQLKQFDLALASYDHAIEIAPQFAAAYSNRGVALNELGRFDAARASYERAISLSPDFAEAHSNLGNVLRDLRRYDAAVQSYDRAIALRSDVKDRGMRLYTRLHICDWEDFAAEAARLNELIEHHDAALNPFIIMAICCSAALQRKAAENWARSVSPAGSLPPIVRREHRGKIKIGYFSADFRDHPVSILTAELFETHDRSRYEVTAFSFGPDTTDAMRRRLENSFDAFIDVRNRSEREIALLARSLGTDIAVDLGGYTQGNRSRIFALRAAPVQVSYLGFPGTLGADFMDYLIADTTIVPEGCQRYYSEKILYVPSFQANDSKRRIADHVFTRQELDLPPEGFVFCCFNANFKITPATFASWMRILQRVHGSVLFLYADHAKAEDNLRREARARGVDAGRLVFGRRLPPPEYLARYRAADLFLDTLPYNAGTTASDALWAGLPVLTCLGETFAGRMAASLLAAVHMPELITSSIEEYEQAAVDLAASPERIADIKRRLAHNRLAAPLFDTGAFTQHLERAYSRIFERYQANLPRENIFAD